MYCFAFFPVKIFLKILSNVYVYFRLNCMVQPYLSNPITSFLSYLIRFPRGQRVLQSGSNQDRIFPSFFFMAICCLLIVTCNIHQYLYSLIFLICSTSFLSEIFQCHNQYTFFSFSRRGPKLIQCDLQNFWIFQEDVIMLRPTSKIFLLSAS